MSDWRGYWRVWPEGDRVRVARDNAEGLPEHLESDGAWWRHKEGGNVPSVPLEVFVAELTSRYREAVAATTGHGEAVASESDPSRGRLQS